MAHIKKIQFNHVGKNEGCLCDRCGQYIQNIWTVTFDEGQAIKFGIDCFTKMNREKLNAFGMKEMNKALKKIQEHQKSLDDEKKLTEETDKKWQAIQNYDMYSDDYWRGRQWAEYHAWRIETWWPQRFREDQKIVDRFGKVNYKL